MVSLEVQTGENFKIFWSDSWDTQACTFTIEEELPLDIYPPSSFSAVAGSWAASFGVSLAVSILDPVPASWFVDSAAGCPSALDPDTPVGSEDAGGAAVPQAAKSIRVASAARKRIKIY